MCGIVGGIAERNVTAILLEGLKRLEYRGYDSAGLAVIDDHGQLERERQVGKVAVLRDAVMARQLEGRIGIAHTRWATHGAPSVANAHPHVSGPIAIVHNGIIENHQQLRAQLQAAGYVFTSQTDTEVAAHLIHQCYARNGGQLVMAVQEATAALHGAYALGVICTDQPDQLIAMRRGSPLVIGLGIGENFIASDQLALLPVTNRFIYLEEGDLACVQRDQVTFYQDGQVVARQSHELDITEEQSDKGSYRHFMLKEIHEQPQAVARTLAQAMPGDQWQPGPHLLPDLAALAAIRQIQIIACGTSYHAGLVARYWCESLLGLPCQVEIASEFRYRQAVVMPDTLLVCISQSGETADTLAALREVQARQIAGLQTLAICNVATSSLIRETGWQILTQAGPEIGVASTKAFTTQLTALLMLVLRLDDQLRRIPSLQRQQIEQGLLTLPGLISQALLLDGDIEQMARQFMEKRHTLFLGRGPQFAIALEGALKLKEISYIHAEGYAAGELKHGPLALVDNDMPVVVLAPDDEWLDKLRANMAEVQARGGELFVFAGRDSGLVSQSSGAARQYVISLPPVLPVLAPILYSLPVQLLSYHVAVLRGTDVDQPRNLAKSVTVE